MDINFHQDGQQKAKLENFVFTRLASDPDPMTFPEGIIWQNTTDGKWKHVVGGAIKAFALADDLPTVSTEGRHRGAFDASAGSSPTINDGTNHVGEDFIAGDYFRVSVAGTINGLIGEDTLEVGDLIVANQDNASGAAQFFGMQANIDTSGFNENQTVSGVSLVTDTPTDVTPGDLAGKRILDYTILDGVNDVTNSFEVDVNQTVPKITVTSITAQSGLKVEFVGGGVADV